MSGGGDDVEREEPITKHIEELSFRLKRILIFFGIALVAVMSIPVSLQESYVPIAAEISKRMVSYVLPSEVEYMGHVYNITVIYTSPFEGFTVILYTSVLLAALISSPYIGYHVYEYVKPALYPNERKRMKSAVAAGTALFLFGSMLGYFIIAPITMKILLIFQAAPAPSQSFLIGMSYSKLIVFILGITLAVGAIFEIPLLIYYLLIYGVLEVKTFKGNNAKLIFLGILIISALITPDPTGVTMLLISVPFYAVLMLGVILAEKQLKKRASVES